RRLPGRAHPGSPELAMHRVYAPASHQQEARGVAIVVARDVLAAGGVRDAGVAADDVIADSDGVELACSAADAEDVDVFDFPGFAPRVAESVRPEVRAAGRHADRTGSPSLRSGPSSGATARPSPRGASISTRRSSSSSHIGTTLSGVMRPLASVSTVSRSGRYRRQSPHPASYSGPGKVSVSTDFAPRPYHR